MVEYKNCKSLIGKKFGKWHVLDRILNKNGHTCYLCECECGKISNVYGCNLSTGKSKGCIACGHTLHGLSNSKSYYTYIQMIERCHNQQHKFYYNYGGRGIFVCDRWLNSFQNFIEDMGIAPIGLSLDRIDNDKGYEKSNCRWVDKKTQNENKRNSIRIGDIINDWEVITQGPKNKTWIIQCKDCEKKIIILSCNFRRKTKHKCEDLFL